MLKGSVMTRLNKRFRLLICLLCLFLLNGMLSGCSNLQLKERISTTISRKYIVENYYIDPELRPGEVRRILLLLPKDHADYNGPMEFVPNVYNHLETQLRRSKNFDIVRFHDALTPDQKKIFDSIDIEKKGSYDADMLYDLSRKINVQGMLFTTVTRYEPHEPFVFGVKLNLIHLRKGSIVWAVDEVFDGSRADVKNLVKSYYYNDQDATRNPSLQWNVILQSMDEFIKFSFYEVVKTYSMPEQP